MPPLPFMTVVLFTLVLLCTCHLIRVNAVVAFNNPSCVKKYGYYTQGSLYQKNLDLLLLRLPSQASLVKFYNSNAGAAPNQVYGLFQCREDLSLEVCSKCVADAAKRIIRECPLSSEAILWYDECMLRYATRSVFSLYEVAPSIHYRGNSTNHSNYNEFGLVLAKTMDSLIGAAAFGVRSRHFATREANVTVYDRLYGLAQCTPDLSGYVCNICLKEAFSMINNCCKGSIRAASFLPNCQLKYDITRFYNQTKTEKSIPGPSPSIAAPILPEKRLELPIIALVGAAASVGLGLIFIGIWFCLKKKNKAKASVDIAAGEYKRLHKVKNTRGLGNGDFVKYDFASLKAATGEFSAINKLGEGGFGVVYKGTLKSGQEIAIKRLSGNSRQGADQFMTEARVVAELQHRNLVKLLGYCYEREEKLLVYEFMPNTSLDSFLFYSRKQALLQWETRYNIIIGITRGLQYLHEESRLTVIHRDLKTSNILLDREMNPKIADFGIAKLFEGDEKVGNTCRISGTQGYMAPEYVLTGEYSEKSDVYSFGVTVLEIVSGRKNKNFGDSSHYEDLIIYACRLWNTGQSFKLVDPVLNHNWSRSEVMKCIQIGILCVQDDALLRPTMAAVALMLTDSIPVPLPSSLATTSPDS